MTQRQVKAAVLLIGDELLSGRTQDVNLQTIAKFLAPLGVQVAEARAVADIPAEIIAAVNELRAKYDYVFTTGGIGPTHDDKTADAMAAAFGVNIDVRDDARAILEAHYKGANNMNEGRLRMARIPDTASLISNPVSKAPGFQIGNVFVLAGVPSIARGMLDDVGKRIEGGAPIEMRSYELIGAKESEIAGVLADLQTAHPDVSVGSYPGFDENGFLVRVVTRSSDRAALTSAAQALEATLPGGKWLDAAD